MERPGRVEGKVALISGGARGMGAEDARLLVAEGAKVVVGDIRDDEGKALADELNAIGDSARYVHLDVTQLDQWEAAVATATGEFGKLDVLVNNAGIVAAGPLREFRMDKWQKVIDVNLTGTFLGMRASVDAMTAAGRGSIINVSSIEGIRGAPMVHPYVASKWAVRGITKSAALELAPLNIRVNSLHPGFIRTPMTAHLPEDMVTIPLGRPAESREVATFVVFLASDESSYATGSEFIVDGGLVTDVPHKDFSAG
jgi:3alpha(or 20beta)-hydroxysteroid dehydrogenase